ncbi:MAG: adenylate/guanylate cyclase domain-containing protein [Chloroflexota bacterium]|nr:MAG: adenylate/guanylate cyclase domain-containing protein [Chloroflexota bacterium]
MTIPDADELIARLDSHAFGRSLRRLGDLSPQATLATYGKGSRALLARTELEAERALHLTRALLSVALGIALGLAGLLAVVPLALMIVLPLAVGGLWLFIWRRLLAAKSIRFEVKLGLALLDVALAGRAAAIDRLPFYGDAFAAGLVRRDDVGAITLALLIATIAIGTLRLQPFVVGLTTLASLTLHFVIARDLAMTPAFTVGGAVVIVFTGFVAVQSARLLRHTALKAREQAVLERYVPEALTRELAATGEPIGTGAEVDITVLIVDIRGYTRRTERLTPVEAVQFLNRYFEMVVAPLAVGGAVLDKYIGDGVFTFFQGDAHAQRAIGAARDILRAVARHNIVEPSADPLRIGIAIHTGRALVGTIGSAHRREYTAIADSVNVAARLEEANKTLQSELVVSGRTIDSVGDDLRVGLMGPTTIEPRGHAAVEVYYLPAGYTAATI